MVVERQVEDHLTIYIDVPKVGTGLEVKDLRNR